MAEFTSGSAVMDRDFVLNIHYKDLFQNRGYFFSNEQGNFLQLDLCPREIKGEEDPAAKKEIIFLLDCSGSMEGDSIQQAKTALEIFLKALTQGRGSISTGSEAPTKSSPRRVSFTAQRTWKRC